MVQISQTSCGHEQLYDSLSSFIPHLSARLRLLPPSAGKEHALSHGIELDWQAQAQAPLPLSAGADDAAGLGCFHLGLEVNEKEFTDLLRVQRNLRDLDLLQRIKEEERRKIGEQIQALLDAPSSITPAVFQAVDDLLVLLSSSNDDEENPRFSVYVGLHSGFQTKSETQFWDSTTSTELGL